MKDAVQRVQDVVIDKLMQLLCRAKLDHIYAFQTVLAVIADCATQRL